jgi:hypothetical protein
MCEHAGHLKGDEHGCCRESGGNGGCCGEEHHRGGGQTQWHHKTREDQISELEFSLADLKAEVQTVEVLLADLRKA